MRSDQEQIRELVVAWLSASKANDQQAVLDLITDDAVFLLPGRPPMRKSDFAASAQGQPKENAPSFDGNSEIQEIVVAGDWAFMWARLQITVTPADGSPPSVSSGHTLTILRRESGKWRLARDANLLTAMPGQ